MVQWLGFCALTAEGLGLIPGWETKILQAAKKTKQNKKSTNQTKHIEIPFISPSMAIIKKIITHVIKDVEKLEPSYTADGNLNCSVTVENTLSVIAKVKHYHLAQQFLC